VLFDVGYGLCDESPRLAVALCALSAALAAHGIRQSPHELDRAYRRVCRNPDVGKASLLMQTAVAVGASRDAAQAARGAVTWDAEPLALLPDALRVLRELRGAGFRLGVLANQPASAADDLRRLGITALADGVWLSEAVGLHKPDPKFFQLALDAWGLPAARVAYVGDRPDNDIAPAKRMGMHTVRLRLGPHAEQAAKHDHEQADYDAESLAAAGTYLAAWAGKH